MNALLSPAIALLNRLRYGAKFTLIAILLTLPLGYVLKSYLSEIGGQISFARNELVGVKYSTPAADVLFNFLQFRGCLARGESEKASEFESKVVKGLDAFNSTIEADKDSLKTQEDFSKVKKAWADVIANKEKVIANPIVETTAFVDALLALNTTIGNNSQLVLDPDIDSYYTMDSMLVQIPAAAVKISNLNLITYKGIKAQSLTADEKTEVVVFSGQVEGALGTMKGDYDQVVAYNADQKKSYEEAYNKTSASVKAFLSKMSSQLVSSSTVTANVNTLGAGNGTIEQLRSYHQVLTKGLDDLLKARDERLVGRRTTCLAIVSFFLAIALYTFIAFYRATVTSLSRLTVAANAMAKGDLNVNLDQDTKDEIGDLYPQFGQLASGLRDITHVATQISQGDLRVSISPRSEVDELGKSLGHMIISLQAIVTELKGGSSNLDDTSSSLKLSSGILSNSSAEVSAAISNVAASSEETHHATYEIATTCESQADSTSQASQAMEQLQTSIADVEAAVNDQIQIVENTQHKAKQNAEAIQVALGTVDNIRKEVLSTSDKVKELGHAGERIGSIVFTINQIAEQTNLLALNAAIEAARAGEHGRGFAVVVDEVRKLAEQSSVATDEIAKLIGEVKQNVNATLDAMKRSNEEVERSASAATSAAGAMDELSIAIQQITGSTDSLATSAQSMLRETHRLSDIIETIATGSEQTAAAAEELSATASEVANTANRVAVEVDNQAAAIQRIDETATELASMSVQLKALSDHFIVEESTVQKAA
jgi:methyl-accepting chemotaxis protein